MKQAFAALFGAAFTAASCYAAGAIFLERLGLTKGARLRRPERWPLAFLLGAAILHLLTFAIFLAQIAYWPVLIAPMLGAIVYAIRSGVWRSFGPEFTPLSRPLKVLLGLCIGAFGAVYLFNAWAPEHSPDGAAYHLGLIARYLSHRGWEPVTTNMYAMLGQGVEMLFAPAFAIGRHSAASLVTFSFAVALAFLILNYGRRIGKPWAGAAAAMLTFLAPIVGKTGTMAYVDVPTAAIVFGCFYWLELWDDLGDDARMPSLLTPAGLLAGYAFAAKVTVFTIGIYAVLFVLFKARKLRPALVLVGCAAIMAGPWILRNAIVYDNPAAPLMNETFRNPYIHISFEDDYRAYFRHYEIPDLRELPQEVISRGGKTQGIIGPAFFLLPLALLALRYRAGRHLVLAGLLVLTTFPENLGTRFLIPALPFFALAISLAFRESAALLGTLIVFHAWASWPSNIPRYAPNAWRIDELPYREALRLVPPDEYLNRALYGYPVARLIEGLVPEGESVLTASGVPDSYTRREIRVSFQSASNQILADILQAGWDPAIQPSLARLYHFPARSVRRIRLLQTADMSDTPVQWGAHEIRLYNGGAELPRTPEWHLSAWPTAQYVQMAFDNSLATRWRPWESAKPGQWIEIDLGSEQLLDQVRLEICPFDSAAPPQLEAMNASGEWEGIDARIEVVTNPLAPWYRRETTRELHLRGIDYFAFYDTDFGAEDFRDDPEAWGLEQIGEVRGARLYRSLWK